MENEGRDRSGKRMAERREEEKNEINDGLVFE